jgi:hypothetical protein
MRASDVASDVRVDYTLPALQPGTPAELPAGEGTELTFRDQLRGVSVELPQQWEQQMGLDARPFTGSYIGPPPRPVSLSLNDADAQRSRWREMLWRHMPMTATPGPMDSAGRGHPVQNMLDMFLEMQQMEDSIVSQSVGVTRG